MKHKLTRNDFLKLYNSTSNINVKISLSDRFNFTIDDEIEFDDNTYNKLKELFTVTTTSTSDVFNEIFNVDKVHIYKIGDYVKLIKTGRIDKISAFCSNGGNNQQTGVLIDNSWIEIKYIIPSSKEEYEKQFIKYEVGGYAKVIKTNEVFEITDIGSLKDVQHTLRKGLGNWVYVDDVVSSTREEYYLYLQSQHKSIRYKVGDYVKITDNKYLREYCNNKPPHIVLVTYTDTILEKINKYSPAEEIQHLGFEKCIWTVKSTEVELSSKEEYYKDNFPPKGTLCLVKHDFSKTPYLWYSNGSNGFYLNNILSGASVGLNGFSYAIFDPNKFLFIHKEN